MELKKLLAAREKVADSIAAFEAEAITHRAILAEPLPDFDQEESSKRVAAAMAHDKIHGGRTADSVEIEESRLLAEHAAGIERRKAARKALDTSKQMIVAFEAQGNNLDSEIDGLVKEIASSKYKEVRGRYIQALQEAVNLMVEAGGYYRVTRDGWSPRVDSITVPGLELDEIPSGFSQGGGGSLSVSANYLKERIVSQGYSARESIIREAK